MILPLAALASADSPEFETWLEGVRTAGPGMFRHHWVDVLASEINGIPVAPEMLVHAGLDPEAPVSVLGVPDGWAATTATTGDAPDLDVSLERTDDG